MLIRLLSTLLFLIILPAALQAQCRIETLSVQDAGCAAGNGGHISVQAEGKAPFTFSWSNGHNRAFADNLKPGIYTLTVTDRTGSSSTQSYTIRQVNNTLDIKVKDQQATLNVAGDMTNPTYQVVDIKNPTQSSLTDKQASPVFTLPPGRYLALAQDSKGCVVNSFFQIP